MNATSTPSTLIESTAFVELLIGRLEDHFGVRLEIADLLNAGSFAEYASLVASRHQADNAQLTGTAGKLFPHADGRRIFPLSKTQIAIWLEQQRFPDRPLFNIAAALRIEGMVNLQALNRSLEALGRRHTLLRTSFHEIAGEPFQVVGDRIDLRATRSSGAADLDDIYTDLIRASPTRLSQPPLLRFSLIERGPELSELIIDLHHIIADATGFSRLIREWQELYRGIADGLVDLASENSVIDDAYGEWVLEQEKVQPRPRSLRFWQEQLDCVGQDQHLPWNVGANPAAISSGIGRVDRTRISYDQVTALNRCCGQSRSTPFTWLLTAFVLVLRRFSSKEQITVGLPVSLREFEAVTDGRSDRLGLYVNLLPARVCAAPGHLSVTHLVGRVREVLVGILDNSDVSHIDLMRLRQESEPHSREPLIETMFSFHSEAVRDFVTRSAIWTALHLDRRPARHALSLSIVKDGSGYSVEFLYDPDRVAASLVRGMSKLYVAVLSRMIEDPAQALSQASRLPEADFDRLVFQRNITQHPYPPGRTVLDLVEAQAELTPDALAVSDENCAVTFSQLRTRSAELAGMFANRHQLEPGDRVLVACDRSSDLVSAILAIWWCGAIYVPVDCRTPQFRVKLICAAVSPKLLITDRDDLAALNTKSLSLTAWRNSTNTGMHRPEQHAPTGDRSAYIIFTSGSTGRPKGVVIRHQSIVNVLYSIGKSVEFTSRDQLLSLTSPSFDISILEFFLPLICGGSVFLTSSGRGSDPAWLRHKLAETKVTAAQATPSMWQLIMEGQDRASSKPLKILCGGEQLSRELAERLLSGGNRVWNLYGPTETTIWSTVSELKPPVSTVTIGRPIHNTQVYVLDSDGEPVAEGAVGEICIGGDGLASGYYAAPDLTASRFIPSPFAGPNGMLYRTGDLGRFHDTGDLECLGRLDDQVKINGNRVEIAEVEAILRTLPEVRHAAVVVQKQVSARLIAFVALQDEQPGRAEFVREQLRGMLPSFMVPAAVIPVAAIPMLASGKIDRRMLTAMAVDLPRSTNLEASPERPATIVEQQLIDLWRGILGVAEIRPADNFFDLGGDSLLGLKIVAQARKRGLRFALADLFEHQTVSELARHLPAPRNPEDGYSECEPQATATAEKSLVGSDIELARGNQASEARHV